MLASQQTACHLQIIKSSLPQLNYFSLLFIICLPYLALSALIQKNNGRGKMNEIINELINVDALATLF